MNEKDLESAVEAMCGELGILRFHIPDSRRIRSGLPDDLLIGARGILWRELKSEAGRTRREQRIVGIRLIRAGQSWKIWRPSDLRNGTIRAELLAISSIGGAQ